MGSKIISIGKKLEFTNPVNSSIVSNEISLEYYEPKFAVQVNWENGASVDMVLSLEVSLDKNNWSELPSSVTISDNSGTHIWDIGDTSVEFVRVKITVNSGNADFSGKLNGKQRN